MAKTQDSPDLSIWQIVEMTQGGFAQIYPQSFWVKHDANEIAKYWHAKPLNGNAQCAPVWCGKQVRTSP
jgi:hypothetical protein